MHLPTRRVWHRLVLVPLLLLSILSLSLATAAPARATTTPRFESATCRFDKPNGFTVECGNLFVPESHLAPTGREISLHVAIIRAKESTAKADPIVYLEGGPGGHLLSSIDFAYERVFRKFGVKRDFIVFDQRGTGLSEPNLSCAEIDEVRIEELTQPLTNRELNVRRNDALGRCYTRLTDEGINLSNYNSAENAADLNDLRVALGYDQWNLYGISYGTRLALTAMRDFPQGIRSVVLDSTVPLQISLYADIPSSADRAFKTLFKGCAANKQCAQAFPGLERSFNQLVKTLNRKPEIVTVSVRGRDYEVMVTGDRLMDTLFDLLYDTESLPYLPQLIENAQRGDLEYPARMILSNVIGRSSISTGFYYSVQCGEEASFMRQSEFENADARFPNLNGTFDMSNYFEVCQTWKVAAALPVENLPVSSTIPTLVMAGQYDPITPPAYGALAAKTLPQSYYFEFPGVGHGASVAGLCPRSIMLSFLDTPTKKPDSSCIRKMEGPKFIVR